MELIVSVFGWFGVREELVLLVMSSWMECTELRDASLY